MAIVSDNRNSKIGKKEIHSDHMHLYIREYFEISVFQISRFYCVCEVSLK